MATRIDTRDLTAARLTATRRELFQSAGVGIGAIALAALLDGDGLSASPRDPRNPLAPRPPHRPARAKSVIHIHMVGAPSHLDLFEDKPALRKHDGEPVPARMIEGQRFAFLRGHPRLLGTRFQFERRGRCGMPMSELLPHLGAVADEIALIKTMHTEEFNHAPAQLFMQTGFSRFGRPSVGSWVTYGLGSENAGLPGFVVLVTGATAGAGNSLWGSAFLPTVYQGIRFRSKGDPVLFLSNPRGVERDDRRRAIEDVTALNRVQLADVGDPEIATRIAQYELAFRMQSSVPELMDISTEPPDVHELYGTKPGRESFANHCLLARRLVERGVRFVQLYDSGWDHHGDVFGNLPKKCQATDRPIAALITDLKRRGLLDETLVVWSSEFGRTPMLQGQPSKKPGRDHHKDSFCTWLAGAGVRGGTIVGTTDDLGYYPVEHAVHFNDLHATILHLLGIDHERLTFRFQGREFRLTDVGGVVLDQMLV